MKPRNIWLILTDQQRFDTIEALGNHDIKTPVLNQLVKKGISFTQAYSPCPVCVPARYSMHTGQLPHRTQCVMNEAMPEDRPSFMELLADQGYQTHGVGKMHFSFKNKPVETLWGFESRDVSEEGGGEDDYKRYLEANGFGHVHDPQGVRSEMYYIPQPSQVPAHLHNTTWVADRSIDFLQKRDRSRPFMLMTSFIKPHPPFENPTPWNKLYRGSEMPLPKRPADSEHLLTFWNKFQNRYKYRDQGIDDHLLRTMRAAYYGTISFIDYNLGRILKYMEEGDLLEDTLIIFTSDHGELLGDYDSFGKRSFLDSAARIPLIMVHPDTPGNMRCQQPVSLVDIMPTLLQFAGIESGDCDHYSGRSLIAIAAGRVLRDQIYAQYHRDEYGVYMAVNERFKYIYSAADDKEWLFHLEADPLETKSLANDPMYIQQKKIMKQEMIHFFQQEQYTAPLEGNDWKRYPQQQLPDDPKALLLLQDPANSLPQIPGYERETVMGSRPFFKIGF